MPSSAHLGRVGNVHGQCLLLVVSGISVSVCSVNDFHMWVCWCLVEYVHLRFLEAFAIPYMPVCVCIIQLVWLQKSTSASSYGCIGRGNSHHCFYFLRKRVCGAVGEVHSEVFFGQQQHDRLGNAIVFDYGVAFISPLGSGWHGPSLLLVCVTARHDWIM